MVVGFAAACCVASVCFIAIAITALMRSEKAKMSRGFSLKSPPLLWCLYDPRF